MRSAPVLAVVVFGLLIQFGCGGTSDDPEGGGEAATSGSQQATGGDRRTSQRGSSSADNGDNAEINIVGEYRYGSDLLGGGTETGRVRISRLGEAYDILMMPAGRPEYYGIGIRTGDHFAICYTLAIERGVGSFVINADGTLTGHWATLGSDGELLSDTWTKVE